MEWIKASFVKLKCSEFMTETEHFNNNTTILILNEELRTCKFYLVLKFIYSKYKDLIYNQQILKEIENYIEMYEISKSLKSFKLGEDLLNFHPVVNVASCFSEKPFRGQNGMPSGRSGSGQG